jgi:hypothetical protein
VTDSEIDRHFTATSCRELRPIIHAAFIDAGLVVRERPGLNWSPVCTLLLGARDHELSISAALAEVAYGPLRTHHAKCRTSALCQRQTLDRPCKKKAD